MEEEDEGGQEVRRLRKGPTDMDSDFETEFAELMGAQVRLPDVAHVSERSPPPSPQPPTFERLRISVSGWVRLADADQRFLVYLSDIRYHEQPNRAGRCNVSAEGVRKPFLIHPGMRGVVEPSSWQAVPEEQSHHGSQGRTTTTGVRCRGNWRVQGPRHRMGCCRAWTTTARLRNRAWAPQASGCCRASRPPPPLYCRLGRAHPMA